MEIIRNGSRASTRPSAQYFHGDVRSDLAYRWSEPAHVGGGIITFGPGAHTAWHSHPLGQVLFFTSGRGWVQRWGGPIEDVYAGDVVWFEPGEKHWHGGTPTTGCTHIAIVEATADGRTVDWMEMVTDEEYAAPAKGSLNTRRST